MSYEAMIDDDNPARDQIIQEAGRIRGLRCSVNVGHVYVVNTTLARPTKDKITICICADDDLFFWINTDARPHGVGQFALEANDHAALTHACHLDCSRATTFLPNELRDAKHRGAISSDLAARIVQYSDRQSDYFNLRLRFRWPIAKHQKTGRSPMTPPRL